MIDSGNQDGESQHQGVLTLKEAEQDECQVHADSSNFASNVSKADAYKQVLEQAEALFEGQKNWVDFMFLAAREQG